MATGANAGLAVITGPVEGVAVTFTGATGRGGNTREGIGAGAAADGMPAGRGGIEGGITGERVTAAAGVAAFGSGDGLGGNDGAGVATG